MPDIKRAVRGWVADPLRDLCKSCTFRAAYLQGDPRPMPKAECRWLDAPKLGCDDFAPADINEIVEIDRADAEVRKQAVDAGW